MRSGIVLILTLFMFVGCAHAGDAEDRTTELSKVEVLLTDFSKKIVAYYERRGGVVPGDFDESQFFQILQDAYPDSDKVEFVRKNFIARARSLDDGYSVMLCDIRSNQKIMEDFSCNMSKVELRLWNGGEVKGCAFEPDWKPLCDFEGD